MKERRLTCIICPRGCSLTVKLDENDQPREVSGNLCPRGQSYAITECTHPMRTVTSTARYEDGGVIPVKTTRPVPKDRVFDVMREINRVRIPNDKRIGDIIIESVAGLDADVIITGLK